MPLAPEIALAGKPVALQGFDPIATLGAVSQLENAQSQRQLRELQIAELARKRQQQLAAAQYFASGQGLAGAALPGSTPPAGATVPPATGLLVPPAPPVTEEGGFTSAGPATAPIGPQNTYTQAPGVPASAVPTAQAHAAAPRYKSAEEMYRDLVQVAGPEIAAETMKGYTEIIKEARMGDKSKAEQEKLKLESDAIQQKLFADILSGTKDNPALYPSVRNFLIKSGSPAAVLLPEQFDAKTIDNLLRTGLSQKERLDAELARMKERREGSEQYTIPTADGIYVAPRFAENPGGQDIRRIGESEASLAPIRKADEDILKKYNDTATTAKDVNTALDEAERLIKEGVYEAGVVNDAALAAYPTVTVPGFDAEKLARTKALREIGHRLTLSNGSLGTGVSEGDRITYQKATGDFASAKSFDSMYESIKTARNVANRATDAANELNRFYRDNKRLPDYARAAVPTREQVREQPKAGSVPTLRLTEADIAATLANPKNAGKTRADILAAAKARGYEVPQ